MEEIRTARKRVGRSSPRDECVDSGLRWGRRRLSSAPAATTSLHHRQHHSQFGIRVAQRNTSLFRVRLQHHGYQRHLERQRNRRRVGSSRHHFCRWTLYGAWGPSTERDNSSDCHKPGEFLGQRERDRDHHQRHLRFPFVDRRERRTGRNAIFPGNGQQPREAGSFRTLGPCRAVLSEQLRIRERKRHLRRAANSAQPGDRRADGHKRS